MAKSSPLEDVMFTRWIQLAPTYPHPSRQVLFHSDQNWCFDFAWIDKLVALEVHGGGWNHGRHNRELGMSEDFVKNNAAVSMGWRVFYATKTMVENDPSAVCAAIRILLDQPVLSNNVEWTMWLARIRNLTKPGDTVLNNGIAVTRGSGSKFTVSLAQGKHEIGKGKMRLAESRHRVLSLILGNPAEFPDKEKNPSLSSAGSGR